MAWQLLAHDATIARKNKIGPSILRLLLRRLPLVAFVFARIFSSFLLCCVCLFSVYKIMKKINRIERVCTRAPANQTVNSLPDGIKLNRTKICQCFHHFGLISVVVFISVATFVLLRFLIHTHTLTRLWPHPMEIIFSCLRFGCVSFGRFMRRQPEKSYFVTKHYHGFIRFDVIYDVAAHTHAHVLVP